ADAVFDALSGRAEDSRRRTPAVEGPTSRMVLDAAFLVARTDARAFRTAVAEAARPLRAGGLDLVLTGPWPPYHFVADEA
ncbi:MAG TPA: GvpL/GvpF family gas vesicle protein, partial [Terriglobales bacterium]|nr:GvpL/GvpF family gas vesicle protein [Terriglobales bacterium]